MLTNTTNFEFRYEKREASGCGIHEDSALHAELCGTGGREVDSGADDSGAVAEIRGEPSDGQQSDEDADG
mgnify:CR=1 FL=1